MHQMDFPATFSNSYHRRDSSPGGVQGQGFLPHDAQNQANDPTADAAHLPCTVDRLDPCSVLNTFGNKKKKLILPPGFEPNKFTVLVGRSRECQEHAGNKRLKNIVDAHLQLYNEAPDKLEKTTIVTEVYNQVRAATAIGHFVKMEKGRYYEVGERTARERIGAMFRDSLSTKYKSSAKNKEAARVTKKASTCTTSQDAGMKKNAASIVQHLWEDSRTATGAADEEAEPEFDDFSDVFD
jgi:hypothetical protein